MGPGGEHRVQGGSAEPAVGKKRREEQRPVEIDEDKLEPTGQRGIHEDKSIPFQCFTNCSLCSTSDLQKGLIPLATYVTWT